MQSKVYCYFSNIEHSNLPARPDGLVVGDEVGQLFVQRRGGVDVNRVAETQGAVGVGPDPLVAVGNVAGEPGGQGAPDIGQFPVH